MEHINNQESLKQWYHNFISYFRKEYEKLSTDERKGISNTNNFLKPCQIEVFWMVNPDYQLIVQSNFNDRPDKEIIVNGPYKPYEFQTKVITILKDKRWMLDIKQNSPDRYEQFDTLGESMALEIYKFVERSRNHFFTSEKMEPQRLTGMTLEDTWTWIHVGNIGDLDHKREIDKTIQEIKQNAKNKRERTPTPKQPALSTNHTYAGFGVHMFPPIIIGTKYKRSIDELVYNTSKNQINSKIFDMKIDNNQIIVNKDGFIFVKSKSEEDALEILNLIMAYGLFYGFYLYAVHEHELVMADYDKQNLIVTDIQWNSETRRAYLIEDFFNPKHNAPVTKREVTLDTIQEILLNAKKLFEYEKLSVHEKLSENMRLLNEGLTHFHNSEFAPAFIMCWSVIERHYSNLWRTLLSEKNIDGKRLSKLNNSNQWTIDYILEVLNIEGKIDKIVYDDLMDLKRKRNKFYHNGEQVTEEVADKCLNYSMRLLADKIYPDISLSVISSLKKQFDMLK